MRRTTSRRGGNAIEFALCLPVFLLTLFGTADFGWLAWNSTSLRSTAAVACRAGSTRDPGEDDDDLATVLSFTRDTIEAQLARDGLPCSDCTITIDTVGDNPNRSLRCRVEREVPALTGVIASVASGTRLSAVAVTRFEYQR